MIREEDWPKVEELVRRILDLDDQRLAVVLECEADLERGGSPDNADHGRA